MTSEVCSLPGSYFLSMGKVNSNWEVSKLHIVERLFIRTLIGIFFQFHIIKVLVVVRKRWQANAFKIALRSV